MFWTGYAAGAATIIAAALIWRGFCKFLAWIWELADQSKL